jgi:hypothetical protein
LGVESGADLAQAAIPMMEELIRGAVVLHEAAPVAPPSDV